MANDKLTYELTIKPYLKYVCYFAALTHFMWLFKKCVKIKLKKPELTGKQDKESKLI